MKRKIWWGPLVFLGLVGAFASCSSDAGECRKQGSIECCRWNAVDRDCPSGDEAWTCVGGNASSDPSRIIGQVCIFTSTPLWSGYCCGI